MHDRKGRLIEVGDHLKFSAWDSNAQKQKNTIGRVAFTNPGCDTCNVTAVYVVPSYWPIQQSTLTAKDTEIVLKADGSEPLEPTDAPGA